MFNLNLAGFACPESFDDALFRTLSQTLFAANIESFVECFRALLDESGTNLCSVLLSLPDEMLRSPEVAWSTGTGPLREALRSKKDEIALVAASQVLLHAQACGVSADWSIRLKKPANLLCSNVYLPHCDSVAALSAGHCSELTLGSVNHITTLLLSDGVIAAGSTTDSDVVHLAEVKTDLSKIVILPGQSAGRIVDNTSRVVPMITANYLDRLTQSCEMLRTISPGYYMWVARATRGLVPTASEEGRLASGTVTNFTGTYFISQCLDLLSNAEMLVHESAHQYFNLLSALGPLANPNHTTKYYSPFPQAMRPLERLLLAYHAFANVLRLHQAHVLATGVSTYRTQRDDIERDVRAVEQILLERRENLTSLGLGIFEPLLAARQR